MAFRFSSPAQLSRRTVELTRASATTRHYNQQSNLRSTLSSLASNDVLGRTSVKAVAACPLAQPFQRRTVRGYAQAQRLDLSLRCHKRWQRVEQRQLTTNPKPRRLSKSCAMLVVEV